MLILFAAERTGRRPHALTVEDLDRELVLAFLDELEQNRNNAVPTRNARLTAIRSFFHHVAANDPASLGTAQRILAIPTKRSHTEVTHYLARHEVDALIGAPDQQTSRGRRDRALLLFLARTGARVSEAIGLVEQLLVEVSALRERVCALEAENAALREENTRLKGLKGRPKLKPSGMEDATNRPRGKRKKKTRAMRRSPTINEEHNRAFAGGDVS